ncbi:tellurite resistance TerB family protein [Verticiella sediminum]|uniref:Tellurite resistance TerB family protein n=1 Tax=Verticiella sediminum TaxID=1247510 RepID=A0A556A6K5_9BURK|nr:tellurite resistance TerB family protein [Verticiella sediminum]TSH88502.1 tellurite resistance TerB family protein [Verticiella sediminum]
MSARQLLEQLLQAGQGLARNATDQARASADRVSQPGGLPPFLSGALGGGALGMLLGGKGMRKFGGKAVKYGGMAALGALAFKAYQQWQQQQAAGAAATPASAPALPAPRTLDRVPAPEAEQHSRAVLVAMIAAAKADGHIGDDERRLLEGEFAKLGEPGDRDWLHAELQKPLDPAQVAAVAQTPEIAAEMYLASLLIVDEEGYMERAYLDELARQLRLDAGFKANLESQVKAVA